ncbi:predicted protein [Brucella sp. 83/13]|nr:predicted protein [Brucella sp. 83/13]
MIAGAGSAIDWRNAGLVNIVMNLFEIADALEETCVYDFSPQSLALLFTDAQELHFLEILSHA